MAAFIASESLIGPTGGISRSPRKRARFVPTRFPLQEADE